MAKRVNRLSSLYVQQENKPGMYPDGGGLYLRISSTGAKSFVLRYMHRSRAREMGLGSVATTSLLQARQKVNECRSFLAEGNDPIELRNKRTLGNEASESRKFRSCAEQYIATHKHSWRHSKHHQQWEGSLKLHVLPLIGDVDVCEINLDMILRVLEPIWIKKPETAQRVRSRIELIIDWGIARGYRTTDNPARWRGLLQTLLPNPSKIKKVRHFPSLSYEEVPHFIQELQQNDSLAARALEFTILTCVRTNEALSLEKRELDLGKNLWIIPSHKTKSGREHRIPLSHRAIEIVSEIIHAQNLFCADSKYVFTIQPPKPLSNMAMLMLLRRLSKDDITVHGFRSSFRTWAAEQSNYPREVAEAALGHVNGDRVEACYQRSDFLVKRGIMMEAWGRFCTSPLKSDSLPHIIQGQFGAPNEVSQAS